MKPVPTKFAMDDAEPIGPPEKFDMGDATPISAPIQKPEDRTAGNYASETIRGVGRGIKDDVVGLYQTFRHPINTATGMVKQLKEADRASQKEYDDLSSAYPSRYSPTRNAASMLTFAENAPIVGGLVQRAEQGGTKPGSPEAVGAAVEGTTALAAPDMLGNVGKAVAKSDFVTSTLPKGLISTLIKPMAGDVKFGKNPAQAILRENITGNSLPKLQESVVAKLNEVGGDIDKIAKDPANASKRIDVTSSFKPLDDAIATAAKNGEKELFDKLVEQKSRLSHEWKPFRDKNGNMSLRAVRQLDLKSMSPADALELKRNIGRKINWSQDPLQTAANKALGSTYGVLKEQINGAVPGLKDLNERYADLTGAGKAIERRIPVHERNAHMSLSDIALGASGHIPLAIARKVLAHPAVTTRVAQGLYRLGDQ